MYVAEATLKKKGYAVLLHCENLCILQQMCQKNFKNLGVSGKERRVSGSVTTILIRYYQLTLLFQICGQKKIIRESIAVV